jgi:tRNA threonylcarbamoyladenosine biosynthesis protein TsaB
LTILAIDTSTQWCSVALVNPQGGSGQPQSPLLSGELIRHENLGPESSQHALDWVEALLEEAQLSFRDLTAIAVGIGPGAFTGIRIGVGIGQGMAFAADLPCLPIVCLDAVALEGIRKLGLKENDQVIGATDARMSEVYWARYVVQANGLPERQDDVYLSAPKDIEIPDTPFALVGNAVTAYPEDMLAIGQQAMAMDETAVPHARSIAQLGLDALEKGLQVSAAELQPIYVRDKVAQTIAERELEKSKQEKS